MCVIEQLLHRLHNFIYTQCKLPNFKTSTNIHLNLWGCYGISIYDTYIVGTHVCMYACMHVPFSTVHLIIFWLKQVQWEDIWLVLWFSWDLKCWTHSTYVHIYTYICKYIMYKYTAWLFKKHINSLKYVHIIYMYVHIYAPTTSSLTLFHLIPLPDSYKIDRDILLWIPCCRRKQPLVKLTFVWFTAAGRYLKGQRSKQINNSSGILHHMYVYTTYSPVGLSSRISKCVIKSTVVTVWVELYRRDKHWSHDYHMIHTIMKHC